MDWNYELAELSYYRFYTFTRIDGLCIGSMVALVQRIRPGFLKKHATWIVLGFAALNFAFYFFNRQFGFSFPYLALAGYTTLAMIFGLLVNECVNGSVVLNTVLGASLLRFFGKISYGLYIIHWPLYILWSPWLTGWLHSNYASKYTSFLASLTATLAAVALSWLSYRFFESYFLKLKMRFR